MSIESTIFIQPIGTGSPIVSMRIHQLTPVSHIYNKIEEVTGRKVERVILSPPTNESNQRLHPNSTSLVGEKMVFELMRGDSKLLYKLFPVQQIPISNKSNAISTIRQQLQNLKLQRDGLTASITAIEQSLHELEQ